MKRLLYIVLTATLLALPRVAPAQAPPSLDCAEYVVPEERNDPSRLALRGVACFEAGQYLRALRHYRRARELSDANLLNAAIGRTFQELGYPFIARRYYRDYLNGPIEESDGRAKIEARLQSVEAELADAARVRIESAPPGTTVFVVIENQHHEELGVTPLDLEMRAGRYDFVFERDGYVTHTSHVNVGSKQDRIVRAELVAEGAAFSVSGRQLRRTGIIAMGAALPMLVAGPALYFVGRNERGAVDELPQRERLDASRSAVTMQNVGIVLTAAGVVTLGAGLTVFLLGRRADADTSAADEKAWRWVPYVDHRTAGIHLQF